MAGRRPLFDLNVAHEDWDWEKGEEAEAEEEEEPEEVVEEGKKEVEVDGEVRRKRKDCEVLVGGLPRDAAEEDVARALADAGDVEEVRLVRDPADPRSNKGFAFVRFAAAWQARWAADDVRTAMRRRRRRPSVLPSTSPFALPPPSPCAIPRRRRASSGAGPPSPFFALPSRRWRNRRRFPPPLVAASESAPVHPSLFHPLSTASGMAATPVVVAVSGAGRKELVTGGDKASRSALTRSARPNPAPD
uniref:RRM domain-containing protein n=1 Tax=Oryza glumipatula TaxID=40148 RepID=A0A0D9Y4P7_9ORYZ